MARAAAKPTPKAKRLSTSPAKRPIGRPPGSKNKVTAKPSRPLPAAPGPKRAATAKTTPPAKLSKADLEAQVVKLERALARSRKQVAELKVMVKEAGTPADRAEADERARAPAEKISKGKPAKQKPVKQKPVAARGRRKTAEQDEQDEPNLDGASGEAETEAHAS